MVVAMLFVLPYHQGIQTLDWFLDEGSCRTGDAGPWSKGSCVFSSSQTLLTGLVLLA